MLTKIQESARRARVEVACKRTKWYWMNKEWLMPDVDTRKHANWVQRMYKRWVVLFLGFVYAMARLHTWNSGTMVRTNERKRPNFTWKTWKRTHGVCTVTYFWYIREVASVSPWLMRYMYHIRLQYSCSFSWKDVWLKWNGMYRETDHSWACELQAKLLLAFCIMSSCIVAF